MGKKKHDYGPIVSAALGGIFFAVPFIGLNMALLPSLGIGVAAFGAGNLLFSPSKSGIEQVASQRKRSLYETLKEAKDNNMEIGKVISKLEDPKLVSNVKEINETVAKIIDTIEKHPDKLDKARSFFDYYLPVTLKILKKYDDIENQRLDSSESKKFMQDTQNMIQKINDSFKTQLSNLYQADIIDTDAEMKVFESMLKSDSNTHKSDFDIK